MRHPGRWACTGDLPAPAAACSPIYSGKGTPAEQYAPDEARHDYAIHRIKQGLIGAGAVALIAALLPASSSPKPTPTVRKSPNFKPAAWSSGSAMRRSPPPSRSSGSTTMPCAPPWIATVGWKAGPAGPGALIGALARALDASPAIEVEAIDWRLGEAEKGSAPAAPGSTAGETALIRGSVTLGRKASRVRSWPSSPPSSSSCDSILNSRSPSASSPSMSIRPRA